MLDTMDEVDRRGWAVPSAQGRLGGIDLARCPGGRGRPPAPHPGRAPELPQAIDRDVDEVGIGGKPVSPRLHLSMHKIVANQLWDDEPPQTRQTARLLALGYERHDVPHMLGSVVAGEVWRVIREDIPFDRARFAEALDALPSSWGRLGASRPSGGRTAGSPHRGRARRDGCRQAA